MKKIAKILLVILVIMTIVAAISPVFATNPSDLKGTPTEEFNSIGKKIIGMVQAIGSIIAVLMLVVLGIKYMMGSAEEKAEYKKTMIPYLIGAVLIFAASQIAGMVYNFASNM